MRKILAALDSSDKYALECALGLWVVGPETWENDGRLNCEGVCLADSESGSTGSAEHCWDGPGQDLQVEPQRPVAYILKIEFHPLVKGQ